MFRNIDVTTIVETRRKSGIHYAWWILVAISIIVGIGKGVLNNSAGLFLSPVSQDLGIGMGTLTLYFSVSAVATMVFLPIGGKLMAKYDPRQIVVGAIILQAGSFALFGLMSSVWGWYLLAIPLSTGGTIIGVIVGPVLINQWFKKKNGLALGVLSAAGGLFGAIAQLVVANLIATSGWRTAYITVGVAAMAIVIPVALVLLKRSPQAHGVAPLGAEEIDSGASAQAQKVKEDGIEVAAARKSVPFYMLVTFFFFVTSISSFSMHIPKHLENIGYDIQFAGGVMGKYMLGVLFGSLVLGYLVDVLNAKRTAILTMALGMLAIGFIIYTTSNTLVISLAVALFGLISASIGIVAPALVTALFGKRDYSQVYSTASMGLAISSIVAIPAYGFAYDLTKSYVPVLWAIIIMLVLNIICVLVAFNNQKKMVAQGLWITENA